MTSRSLAEASQKEFGLYLHIPFCSFLCHYCDFAKTARWDEPLAQQYFASLGLQLAAWLQELKGTNFSKFTSVNIGGGTPSLFTREYAPLLELVGPYLAAGAEVSLEANPADVSAARLKEWAALGFNRLSLGVQTLQDDGLKFLKRDHSSSTARTAIELAMQELPHVNVDLIYSWQGQSAEAWRADLRELTARGVPHLSLYNLTYAAKTPLGRAQARGRLTEAADDEQEAFYEAARAYLQAQGYEHDEVSNWAKRGFTCRHNWLYWRAAPYLGVGVGACGFLPAGEHGLGLRYGYTSQMRPFLQLGAALPWHPYSKGESAAATGAALTVDMRDREAWLMEYVGCGLRCREGVDLARIAQVTGLRLQATPLIRQALTQGKMARVGEHLTLHPQEWFRETAWSLALLDCFN